MFNRASEKNSGKHAKIRPALVAAVILTFCFLSLFLFACGEDNPAAGTAGIVYSGKITFENKPLSFVSVCVNDKEKVLTDSDGIFVLRGLSYGDTITFVLDGFEFYPNSLKVNDDGVYDLNVTALRVTTPDPDEEDPSIPDPDNPDVPDVPDIPDIPDVPDVPEEPDVPDVPDPKTSLLNPENVSFITKDGKIYLVFALDCDTETLSVRHIVGDVSSEIFNAAVDIIPENGYSDETSGCRAYFVSEMTANDNRYLEFAIEVTPAFLSDGAHKFEITSIADKLSSASATSPAYVFYVEKNGRI